MDPAIEPLVEILRQINDLSGAALEALLSGGGGEAGGEIAAPPGSEAPAPEQAPA